MAGIGDENRISITVCGDGGCGELRSLQSSHMAKGPMCYPSDAVELQLTGAASPHQKANRQSRCAWCEVNGHKSKSFHHLRYRDADPRPAQV